MIARHLRVVMLAGMYQPVAQRTAGRAALFQRADDRRNLHEIGARPGDDVDQHG
jgi:hypothetical protein